MTEYVLGFLFGDRGRVALIRKARPAWQRGRLNGVGGRIETGEDVLAAMVREFWEETGYVTFEEDWSLHVRIRKPDCTTFVFAAHREQTVHLKQDGPEPGGWYDLTRLPVMYDVIPNLRWLIPFCLDGGPVKPLDVPYPNPDGTNSPGLPPWPPTEASIPRPS